MSGEKLIRVFDVFWNTTMLDPHAPYYRSTEEQLQWVYDNEGGVYRRLAWCLREAPDSMVVVMKRLMLKAEYDELAPDEDDPRSPRQIRKAASRARRRSARKARR